MPKFKTLQVEDLTTCLPSSTLQMEAIFAAGIEKVWAFFYTEREEKSSSLGYNNTTLYGSTESEKATEWNFRR